MFCFGSYNFLANITVRLALGLNALNNITQNNSRPKPNYKIVYRSLKSLSVCGIGARGDTKCHNLKRSKYLEKESLWQTNLI